MLVRTTLQPWRDIDVDDAEYRELRLQGLLAEDQAAAIDGSLHDNGDAAGQQDDSEGAA